eukprot:187842-Pelagomonas_calceolata.AAC.2
MRKAQDAYFDVIRDGYFSIWKGKTRTTKENRGPVPSTRGLFCIGCTSSYSSSASLWHLHAPSTIAGCWYPEPGCMAGCMTDTGIMLPGQCNRLISLEQTSVPECQLPATHEVP